MNTVIMNFTCFIKVFAYLVAVSKCVSLELPLTSQRYFRRFQDHDDILPQEDTISSYASYSKVECSLKCLQTSTCVGYNYMNNSNLRDINCQLSSKAQKTKKKSSGNAKWTLYQVVEILKTHVVDFTEGDVTIVSACPAATKIRLNGSCDHKSGRVEIYNELFGWGTICDDFWSLDEGNVTCRQLGFTGAKMIKSTGFYGKGTGPILLDDVRCAGNESFIWDCSHRGWNDHNCHHYEDAGVECY